MRTLIFALIFATPLAAQISAGSDVCDPNNFPMAVHLPESEILKLLIHRVEPKPPLGARVQGTVILSVVINEQGEPVCLNVLSGPPPLTSAAIEALHQWRFKPYLVINQPRPVFTQLHASYPPSP